MQFIDFCFCQHSYLRIDTWSLHYVIHLFIWWQNCRKLEMYLKQNQSNIGIRMLEKFSFRHGHGLSLHLAVRIKLTGFLKLLDFRWYGQIKNCILCTSTFDHMQSILWHSTIICIYILYICDNCARLKEVCIALKRCIMGLGYLRKLSSIVGLRLWLVQFSPLFACLP